MRQQEAVFRRLGEDATWSGVADPVRVRFAERDEMASWSDSRTVHLARFVRVRRSQVPAPASGDVITRTEHGDQQLVVIETPTLDRKGVWLCAVKEA